MDSDERELALRVHIRSILLDYALTHLTINYVNYTENLVSELLGPALHTIPTRNATSLALEPTLYEQIDACLDLNCLPPHNDKWSADAQSLAFLKQCIAFKPDPGSPTSSSGCWADWEHERYARPDSPILTSAARKLTPLKESQYSATRTSSSLGSILDSYRIKPTNIHNVDEGITVNLSDALGHRIPIDAALRSEMLSLLSAAIAPTGRNKPSTWNVHEDTFLRANSPTDDLPRPLSPPIFSRESLPGTGCEPMGLQNRPVTGMKELSSMLLPKANIEADDLACEDRYRMDMVVINDWHTFRTPSSPTPSLDSDREEISEKLYLERLISSSSSPSARDLPNMMDEHMMPRTEKFGGAQRKADLPGQGQRLGDFLSFLQHLPHTPRPATDSKIRVESSPKSQPSSRHTSITASLSMLGQPPTILSGPDDPALAGVDTNGYMSIPPSSDDSIGLQAVMKILDPKISIASKGPFDPSAFILDEKLQESDTFLMNVPDLPPPNEHQSDGTRLPKTFDDLLDKSVKTAAVQGSHTVSSPYSFLKKIKRLQSVNMVLNWRPFTCDENAPTHEELAKVIVNIQEDCLTILREDACGAYDAANSLAGLLGTVFLDHNSSESERNSLRSTSTFQVWNDDNVDHMMSNDPEDSALILTARERRRLFDLPDPVCEVGNSEAEGTVEEPNDYPSKRHQAREPSQDLELVSSCYLPLDVQAPHNTVPDDMLNPDFIDDSGVFLSDPSADGPCRNVYTRKSYAELSGSAIGFEGPDDNIDALFADLDPGFYEAPPGAWFSPHFVSARSLISMPGFQLPTWETSLADNLDRSDTKSYDLVAGLRSYSTGTLREEPQDRLKATEPDIATGVQKELVPNSDTDPTKAALCDSLGWSRRSLQHFLKIRAKAALTISESVDEDTTLPAVVATAPLVPPTSISIQVPGELMDHFLVLPDQSETPGWHRYLASLEFIQRLGISRALSTVECKVLLTERETLAGADLIVDPHCAIILTPLRALPTQTGQLTNRINQLSWRFSRIMVVLEAFASDYATNELTVDPFSPPVVKAARKLKRDLEIAEACLDKEAGTRVYFAFPMSTHAAAKVIRKFGDIAQAQDISNISLWDDRQWLELDEEDPDERDLAAVDGMNVFAAAVILSRNSLDAFLDKPPELRSEQFGELVGYSRINTFNRTVARRIEAMQLPSSSPPTTSVDSLNLLTPVDDHDGLL